MRFYDCLQLDPALIKREIRSAETPQQRHKFQLALLVRSILLVLFAILLIAPVGPVFGPENSCVGVVTLCILLSTRFIDFGYRTSDALIGLGISFLMLLVMPAAATLLGPVLGILPHFIALFVILTITSESPEMGNGGLYTFAYILLVGNPVSGELFWKRALLIAIGYSICAVVYFCKHRTKNQDVRFRHVVGRFHLSLRKCRWQLQVALGLSILLGLGEFFQLERMMWAGFACGSMLGCYSSTCDTIPRVKTLFGYRILGVLVGSSLFYVIYQLLPPSLHPLFGPMGGVCLGFCTDYRYKTAVNCFGALLLATDLYGLQGSVMLRIVDNFLGAAFGFAFSVLYQKLMDRHFEPNPT